MIRKISNKDNARDIFKYASFRKNNNTGKTELDLEIND